MVPINHKNKSLNQYAAEGMTSLLQQGALVLMCFVTMLVITGGAPSGLAVVLTVGVTGVSVTWSEQRRLTQKQKKLRIRKTSSVFEQHSLSERMSKKLQRNLTSSLNPPKLKNLEDQTPKRLVFWAANAGMKGTSQIASQRTSSEDLIFQERIRQARLSFNLFVGLLSLSATFTLAGIIFLLYGNFSQGRYATQVGLTSVLLGIFCMRLSHEANARLDLISHDSTSEYECFEEEE